MREKRGILKRLLSVALVVMMIATMFVLPASALPWGRETTTQAPKTENIINSTVTKKERKYEIAVVFDNSGSMYLNKSWSRAKYAMEIFASMLNYSNGDVLKIYPMWPVKTDGSTPETGGELDPIEIRSGKDLDKISNLYTIKADSTPFEPVYDAFNDLEKSDATDRWLIVLTDGAFGQNLRTDPEDLNFEFESKLRDLSIKGSSNAERSIKVQYLGFGSAKSLASNPEIGFYSKKSTDTSLKNDLVDICNTIFQRSELTNKLNGNKVTFDMSMKNVIVFAQGPNAEIKSLTDSQGHPVNILLDSKPRKYSTLNASNYKTAPYDNTLAGQVVTFGACKKGEYTLEFSGVDKIQIFYEPDVSVKMLLRDSDGRVVDTSKGQVVAGDYTLEYKLCDGQTGEDITNSPLLGEVELQGFIKDGSGKITLGNIKSGQKITLTPQKELFIHVKGTYLKDYTIDTESSGEGLSFPGPNGGVVPPHMPELKAEAKVLQDDSWYNTRKQDEWKPIRINLTLDGKPLTDEQLKAVKLDLAFSDNITYTCKPVNGESAYEVYICQDKDGQFVKPGNMGKYKMNYTASIKGKYDQESKSEGFVKFEVQNYGKGVKTGLRLFILGVIVAAIIAFMCQKTLPKEVTLVPGSTGFEYEFAGDEIVGLKAHVSYDKKNKKLTLGTPKNVPATDAKGSVTLSLKPVDRRYVKSKDRSICVTGISASNISHLEVGAVQFDLDHDSEPKKLVLANVAPSAQKKPLDKVIKNSRILIKAEDVNGGHLTANTTTFKLKHK